MSSTSTEKQVKVIKKYRVTGDIDRSKRTAVVATKIDSSNILPETATRKRKDYTYSTKTNFEAMARPQARASANVYEKRNVNKENTKVSNIAVEQVTQDMSKMRIRKRTPVSQNESAAKTVTTTTQASNDKTTKVLSDAVAQQIQRLKGTIKPITERRCYSTRSNLMPVHIQTFIDSGLPDQLYSKTLAETFAISEFALPEDELDFDFVKKNTDYVLLGESDSYLLLAQESQSNADFIVHIVHPEQNKTVASLTLAAFLSTLQ